MSYPILYSVEVDLGPLGVRFMQFRARAPYSRKLLRSKINAALRPHTLRDATEVSVCAESSTWLTL